VKNPIYIAIEGCKKNDRQAQQSLFELMAPKLLSVARQYGPRRCDAMDILHDSFIKIYKYIHSYDSEKGDFEAWARKIVINMALNKLNRNKLEELVNNYDDFELPDMDLIYQKYGIDHIKKMVDELPDIYKQVFCLYEIEGYSHKEIADQLNIKETTSRSQLNRSKEMLRALFNQHDEDGYYFKTQKN
jgi:RNA polymerase sigma factor (sigma-70 family)